MTTAAVWAAWVAWATTSRLISLLRALYAEEKNPAKAGFFLSAG